MLVNLKEIFKLKVNNKNGNPQNQFCLRSISNEFGATKSREVHLKVNFNDFSVDYNVLINHKNILNIH